MPVLYNNNPIIHTTFTYMENASSELALMPVLYNNHPNNTFTIIHLVRGISVFCATIISPEEAPTFCTLQSLARGNTRIPRILSLTRGNTNIPCTSVSPEGNTHFPRTSPNHYVWRPQRFGTLHISQPGFGKLPARQYLWSPSLLFLNTQLGRVSPYV